MRASASAQILKIGLQIKILSTCVISEKNIEFFGRKIDAFGNDFGTEWLEKFLVLEKLLKTLHFPPNKTPH